MPLENFPYEPLSGLLLPPGTGDQWPAGISGTLLRLGTVALSSVVAIWAAPCPLLAGSLLILPTGAKCLVLRRREIILKPRPCSRAFRASANP